MPDPTLPLQPEPGDVFLLDVPEGPPAVCRIGPEGLPTTIGRRTDRTFHVALCEWALERAPTLEEALALPVLTLEHYRLYPVARPWPAVFRASGLLLEGFTRLGHAPLTGAEPTYPHDGGYHWCLLGDMVHWERLYQRDPADLERRWLALHKARDRRARSNFSREQALARQAGGAASPAPLAGLDLDAWRAAAPDEVIAEIRALMATLEAALSKRRSRRDKAAALRACVKGLNALDARRGPFIDTVIAEALFDALSQLGQEAGLEDADEVIEEVREF
jgi:hypothetical protein